MLYIGVLLIMLAIASSVALNDTKSIYQENVNTDAKAVLRQAATEINIAVEVGDGYNHRVTMPYNLYGDNDYTINVTGQKAYIFWNNRTYLLPVMSYNVTGTFAKGDNLVKNVNGVIFIA